MQRLYLKTNPNGTLRIQEVTEVNAKLCKSAWDAVRHQSPSSFQHNHISKFQKGKTQHNPIPNGTDTLGKFRTYKNAGKNIDVPNHVFQNTSWTQHAPTSRNLSPKARTKTCQDSRSKSWCFHEYAFIEYTTGTS